MIQPQFVDSEYLCAAARKRGYIHNLPIENREPLHPLPPKTIFEAFPNYKKWWPSWDTRIQLNFLRTCVASPGLAKRISDNLASSGNPVPQTVQKIVLKQCKKENLVWVGKNKLALLKPGEIECLLSFPKDHTRGLGTTGRYKSIGNSFHVDTVAYHLSVLRVIFPIGINVMSLFTGIGGGEVALHRLGIHMKTGRLTEIDDVKSLTDERVASFVTRFGGFDLVIGGSPCNNLVGCNRYTRNGLEGEQYVLFYVCQNP